MASKKITDLPVLTAPASGDLIELVDVSDTTDNPAGSSKEVTLANTITKAHGLSDSTAVGVSSGVLTSGTDVAIVDGGTGASSASGARTNLGVAIGTDVVAPNQDTTGKSAKTDALNSATTVVNVSAATAPSTGQALIATDSTHATWQSLGGGGDALTSGTLAQFAPTTSLELKNLLTNETGSGAAVFATSPALVTPTGIVKGDVGLGNVDNTSDATKDAASTTLTNKTLTTPTIGSFANANHNHSNSAGGGQITDSALSAAVGISKGGTGQTTKAPAFDALSPMTTAGDLITGGASGTGTRLGMGTTLQQIRVNAGATALEYFTPAASGGQTLYDAVVAASGGDYTTLGAAIAGGAITIFVRKGTYTESAITSSVANLTIVGADPLNTVISMGANAISLSGNFLSLINIRIEQTDTGTNAFSGTDNFISGCQFFTTGTSGNWVYGGARLRMTNCIFDSASTTVQDYIRFTGANQKVDGIQFNINPVNSTADQGTVRFTGANCVLANSIFLRKSTGSFAFLSWEGSQFQLLGCNFKGNSAQDRLVENFAGSGGLVSGCIFDTGDIGFKNGGNSNVTTGCKFVSLSNGYGDIGGTNDNVCTGNVFQGITSVGIKTNSGSNARNVYSGNKIDMTSAATAAISMGAGTNCVISGNVITGASVSGTGIAVQQNYTTVIGNSIKNTNVGIQVINKYCTITGNDVADTVTTPITLGTSTQTAGSTVWNNTGASAAVQKRCVRMKNTSGGTVNAGNLVVRKAVAAGDEITTTTTAGDTKAYGCADEAISNNATGFICVEGKTDIMTVDGTTDIAIGDYVGTFTSAGIGQKATASVAGVTVGDIALAYALEAYATNDSSGVIDALLIPAIRL